MKSENIFFFFAMIIVVIMYAGITILGYPLYYTYWWGVIDTLAYGSLIYILCDLYKKSSKSEQSNTKSNGKKQ